MYNFSDHDHLTFSAIWTTWVHLDHLDYLIDSAILMTYDIRDPNNLGDMVHLSDLDDLSDFGDLNDLGNLTTSRLRQPGPSRGTTWKTTDEEGCHGRQGKYTEGRGRPQKTVGATWKATNHGGR